MASAGSGRLEYIDTLRGLAALYVLLYHTALVPNPALPVPASVGWIVLNGGTGVTLFFVVSAFTLCLSSHAHAGEPDALFRYAVRRVFRIVPLFYVWVALSWVRDAATFGVFRGATPVLLNLTFLYNFVPGEETSFVWAGWTLGVEMLFYAMFPWIFLGVTTVGRAVAFLSATIGVAALHQRIGATLPIAEALRASYLHFSVFHMLPVFACGVLAWRVHERFIAGRRRSPLLSIVLVAVGLGGYVLLLNGRLSTRLDSLYWQAVVYSALLLGLSIVPWRLFVNPATVYLGTISYSLYLNHPTIIILLRPIYRWFYAQPIPLMAQFAASAVVTLTVVVIVSTITYRWIEQPCIRFGSRLIKRSVVPHRAVQGVS